MNHIMYYTRLLIEVSKAWFESNCIYMYIFDQARGQDGWILASFSFCVFMDRDEVEVHKNAKREPGQYPAILTKLAWSIKKFIIWHKEH